MVAERIWPAVDTTDPDGQLEQACFRAALIVEFLGDRLEVLAFPIILTHLLEQAAESQPRSRPQRSPSVRDVAMEPAEFLASLGCSSHAERLVAIAYYYDHRYEGRGISVPDVRQVYVKARCRQPQNWPDVIASSIKRGWLVDGPRVGRIKTWLITRTGEQHVEGAL